MIKDYGIFVGLSCIPQYSEYAFNFSKFIDDTLDPLFNGYKSELAKNLLPLTLESNLYSPIHFYAFGHFNVISLSLIDDFYFSNFHFRPNSKHTKSTISNFQYQIVNCLNNSTLHKLDSFNELKGFNYIGISKIKINPILILKHGHRIISFIKERLLENSKNYQGIISIISDSHSWHDLTIINFSNSLELINSVIINTRKMSCIDLIPFNEEFERTKQITHIFVDTHTTFGINPEFFTTNSSRFEIYSKENIDTEINIFSKIHIKTGHGEQVRQLTSNLLNKHNINFEIRFIDGRSDHAINFSSIFSFISFWKCLQIEANSQYIDNSNPLYHIRKIHSNISFKLPEYTTEESIYDINSHFRLFDKIKFKHSEIIHIEACLKKLKVSKEQSNCVVSAFNNFNDLATDVNLFPYFLDTYPLLHTFHFLIVEYSTLNDIDDYNPRPSKTVKEIVVLINTFLETWQNSFLNRFQESKRYEYNSDSKTEFNGGVHQVLETYDSIYKLVVNTFSLVEPKDILLNLPITTYGSQKVGIKSTHFSLHVNYFQLFQPEFFLFVLKKEAFNHQFSRYFLNSNLEFYQITLAKLSDFAKTIPIIIHTEPDIKIKKILFDYCDPSDIKKRLRYIITYSNWINNTFNKELDLFVFWFWGTYFQSSENYNTNGSLKLEVFRRTLFDFTFTLRMVRSKITLENVTTIIKCQVFNFLLNYKRPNVSSIIENCNFAIDYISKKSNIIEDSLLVINRLAEITDLLEKKSESNLINELNKITLKYLRGLKDEITSSGELQFVCHRSKNGSIINSNKYSPAIFDPQGGIFVRSPKLRKLYFRKRIEVLLDLKEIAIKFKQFYFESIIK